MIEVYCEKTFPSDDAERQSFLIEAGLGISNSQLATLTRQSVAMVERSMGLRNDEGPAFRCLSSYLPAKLPAQPKDSAVLTLDYGGTKTSFNLCHFDESGRAKWYPLASLPSHDSGFDDMASFNSALFSEASKNLKNVPIPERLKTKPAIAYLWSNSAMAELSGDGSEKGITLKICDREKYQKDEDFIPALSDGDDLNVYIQTAAQNAGLPFSRIIGTNDTIGDYFADPDGVLGILINATGYNGTGVRNGIVINPERAHEILPLDCVGVADIIDRKQANIEQAAAMGNSFAPARFAKYISYFARRGYSELQDVDSWIKSRSQDKRFEGKDLCDLSLDEYVPFLLNNKFGPRGMRTFDLSALSVMSDIAKALITRSARLSAKGLYLGICNLDMNVILGQRPLRFAMDSPLAAAHEGFRNEVRETLAHILTERHGETCGAITADDIDLRILKTIQGPDGLKVSAAQQGLARVAAVARL